MFKILLFVNFELKVCSIYFRNFRYDIIFQQNCVDTITKRKNLNNIIKFTFLYRFCL